MCEHSGDWIHEWCRLSVCLSRRVWQTGSDAATAAHTMHWYNRWILLTGSLLVRQRMCTRVNPLTSCHHAPWVGMDGRTLIAKAPLDRTWRAEICKLYRSRTLHIANHCCSESIFLIYERVEETMAGRHWQQSLSVGRSMCACERRASTLSWCHQRLIELRPSFISPCYGLLC